MADQKTTSWGLLPRVIVSAIAAMVISLALKPYQGKITPYVKNLESGFANVKLDSEPSARRASSERIQEPRQTSRKKEVDLIEAESLKDKITDKDKTQLKSVLDKL